jgi:HTH-type transcriptional regulator/antitoxin HigA
MTLTMLEKKLRPYEDPVKDVLAKWLYTHVPPRPITGKKMYTHYREVVRILMHEIEGADCNKTLKAAIQEYLNSVSPFLEEYEKKEYPVGAATPEEMLQFLMEQKDLSQYDIAGDVGGQPVVSDILRGKRKLTRDHIERLSKRFGVSPATFFSAES